LVQISCNDDEKSLKESPLNNKKPDSGFHVVDECKHRIQTPQRTGNSTSNKSSYFMNNKTVNVINKRENTGSIYDAVPRWIALSQTMDRYFEW
jgi:hypothetical protein